jgi:Zn-dependent M28 family amino/carboxypeptidase
MKIAILIVSLVALPFLVIAQKLPFNKQQLLQDIRILSSDSMQGRLSGSKGNVMAQAYILKRFQSVGLKPFPSGFKQYFRFENKGVIVEQATNIIGYIPGKSDKVIVLTAHYDHIGINEGEIYNGADDNASGVGGLLAIATYYKNNPPKHTIIFAALDGEELGHQGARAFLENPPVTLDKIILNVNLDMLSANHKGELYASGSYHNPSLKPYLKKVAPTPKAKLLLGHDRPEQGQDDWTSQSDHYQFHKKKIPFVYFGVEDHQHYHKPTDDYANINPDFYAEAVALIIDFLKIADNRISK